MELKNRRIRSNNCEICGVRLRATYNSKGFFGLHSCAWCRELETRFNRIFGIGSGMRSHSYSRKTDKLQNLNKKIGSLAHETYKSLPWWLSCYESDRLEREFLRKKRERRGDIDPKEKCPRCKQEKSIFEFSEDGTFCYFCEAQLKNSKVCPGCRKRIETSLFFEGDNRYEFCQTCRNRKRIRDFRKNEKFLSFVPDRILFAMLKKRSMQPTGENVELIRAYTLAKRTLFFIKNEYWRKKYESDYSYVYGKQQTDDKNITGEF